MASDETPSPTGDDDQPLRLSDHDHEVISTMLRLAFEENSPKQQISSLESRMAALDSALRDVRAELAALRAVIASADDQQT